MSLRTLSKHLTEAKYAHNWRDPNDSTKAAGHRQYAINRFHRAVRRSEREVVALALLDLEDELEQAEIDRDFAEWGESEPWGWDADNDLTPSELDDLYNEERNRAAHEWASRC